MKKTLSTILLGTSLFLNNCNNTERELDTVKHISSDSIWDYPVLIDKEYEPSYENSILKSVETDSSDQIKGGFNKNIKIFTHYGTFIDTVDDESIEELIQKNKDNMNENAIPFLKDIAKDKYIFDSLEQFFTDGGSIYQFKNWGGGQYINEKKLQLLIGDGNDSLDTKRILFHELLHYVFDKSNNLLAESHDSGGADHSLINPLEDRFRIMKSVREGNLPLNKQIRILYGYAKDGKIGEKITNYDVDSLENFINSEWFYKTMIHNVMVTPLSLREYALEHPDTNDYLLTIENIQDLAYENDYNASLAKKAFNIAINNYKNKNIPLEDTFKDYSARKEFFNYARKQARWKRIRETLTDIKLFFKNNFNNKENAKSERI